MSDERRADFHLNPGFYITTKGEKVPNLPDAKIGEEVRLVKGQFMFPEKKEEEAPKDETVSREEFEAMKAQNEKMAKLIEENLGEKGSNAKAGAAPTGGGK